MKEACILVPMATAKRKRECIYVHDPMATAKRNVCVHIRV
jgi:hypothetical protein